MAGYTFLALLFCSQPEKKGREEERLEVDENEGKKKMQTRGRNENEEEGNGSSEFDIVADMKEKCGMADALNREKYWYYLKDAELLHSNHIPTSKQYYCVFVYVNIVGTFLSISYYDLETETKGVNTLVRLGNGKSEGANYGPVKLTPAIL